MKFINFILTILSLILSLEVVVYICVILSNGNEKFNQECGSLCIAIIVSILVLWLFRSIVFYFFENTKALSAYIIICFIIFLIAIFLMGDCDIDSIVSFMELGGYKNGIKTTLLSESDIDVTQYILVRIMPIISVLFILELINAAIHLDEAFDNKVKKK